MDPETQRLADSHARRANWQRWGSYLAERQWGTVREDYSADGDCWNYFPFSHSHLRAYRWGEDGLLGITDRECRLCFALALWNGKDPILKERLFGLNSHEGNHGEDVKECYHYLAATPTASYLQALYRYPQAAYPYDQLRKQNAQRTRDDAEFEIFDTGVFDNHRYFDITAEYAKGSADDICIRLTVTNHGPDTTELHLLPTIWYRNTWSWGAVHEVPDEKPRLELDGNSVIGKHAGLGTFRLVPEGNDTPQPRWLFTENETNSRELFQAEDGPLYTKDAFHRHVIDGHADAVNPDANGTKAAAWYKLDIGAGESRVIRLRLFAEAEAPDAPFGNGFEELFDRRQAEMDVFYQNHCPDNMSDEECSIERQAYAGLLWSKQFYHYIVDDWIRGDPGQPKPPDERLQGRNADWLHLYNRDVISMPDKWEYPWYASWDLAFHMIPFAEIDPEFAKGQLQLFLREWYMHPNGELPAYEFSLSDVNPPVHAWSAWRVYKMAADRGERDQDFLSRVFQKLLMNFTWWVNRKDPDGNHVFSGGFLGMDNIGVFDRSKPLPGGGQLDQADGTAWMAFYCSTMLEIAMELATRTDNPAAEDVASKFFEHFVSIADAMNYIGGDGLWDEEEGFYYDQLSVDGDRIPLKVRSLVGLIPLLAVSVLHEDDLEQLPDFRKRMNWFLKYRPELGKQISYLNTDDGDGNQHRLLAIPSRERLERVLRRLFDEDEFLSPYGIRSMSKAHRDDPFVFDADGRKLTVGYVPGESSLDMFGGNSNWRGPVWMPINYLIIEALERYDHFYQDSLLVELPTGSGNHVRLAEAAKEISRRLIRLFRRDKSGLRPCLRGAECYQKDPQWMDLLLFHEYFHGDHGQGLGASHQTGWTALITKLMQKVRRPADTD